MEDVLEMLVLVAQVLLDGDLLVNPEDEFEDVCGFFLSEDQRQASELSPEALH